MTCEDCIHVNICMEQRGLCREFKTLGEIKSEIEMLHKKYQPTAGTKDSDKDSPQSEVLRRRTQDL